DAHVTHSHMMLSPTPLLAMVWIVLGRDHVGVESVRTQPAHQVEPLRVAEWRPVVPLDRTDAPAARPSSAQHVRVILPSRGGASGSRRRAVAKLWQSTCPATASTSASA